MKLSFYLIILTAFFALSCSGGGGGSESSGNTNQNPTIQIINYVYYAQKNTPIQISLPDSSITLVSFLSTGTKGFSTISDNKINFNPILNAIGDDSLKIKAIKSNIEVHIYIKITITATNTAPTASNFTINVQRGTGIYFNLIGNDTDGDTLSYELLTTPSAGTIILKPANGINWAYDAPNSDSTQTFTYRSFDGQLYSNIATVTINVTRPNIIPSFPLNFLQSLMVNEKVQLNEDSFINYSFTMIDPDDSNLIGTVITTPLHGTLTLINNGNKSFNLNYIPNHNYYGDDTAIIKFTDSVGGSIEKFINFKILPVNDAPNIAITNVNINLIKNDLIGKLIDLQITDPDSSSFSFIYDSNPSTLVDLQITSSNKLFILPKFNKEGSETIIIRITDGQLTSLPLTLNIKVSDYSQSINPINQELILNQLSSLSFVLEGTNTINKNISFNILSYPEGGISSIAGTFPNLIYTPPNNFYGSTTLIFNIYDEDLETVSSNGIISFTVQRTNFSNTWSISSSGDLYENILLKEDSSFSFENFFISELNFETYFSLYTPHMNCSALNENYTWLNLSSNRNIDLIDLSNGWTCYNSIYLQSINATKTITHQDITNEIIQDNFFTNYFDFNTTFKFNEIKQLNSCSDFNSINELIFNLGEETQNQENCYIDIYISLKNKLPISTYYPINNESILNEGVYSIVNIFLNYIQNKELLLTEDKLNFIQEVNNQLLYYTKSKHGFFNHFESCNDFFSSQNKSFININDNPKSIVQLNCIFDIFNFFDLNYPEFYLKTGLTRPNNIELNNSSVHSIVEQLILTFNDESFSENNLEQECLPEQSTLYTYIFANKGNQSVDSYMKNLIPECSQSYLESIQGYNSEISIYNVLSNDIPEVGTESFFDAIKLCQNKILNQFADKIYYELTNTKKGITNDHSNIFNKANTALILSTAKKFDTGICIAQHEQQIPIDNVIYQDANTALFVDSSNIKKEIFLGYKKTNNIDYITNYLLFNGTNIKRISLISSNEDFFTDLILYLNEQIYPNNNLGDFIKIPNSIYYTKIGLISDEIHLTGLYINESNKMVLTTNINDFIGKLFISSNKMIFNTYHPMVGYYLYEIN